ncbi:MAG: hypothetical protein RMM98_01755 [Acidobacteriota bacterium]|nr:hypothetical protein [Blastocatellia bacterium]MDW8238312.1 hypothetical protein [Acidobacteriota bacterium]
MSKKKKISRRAFLKQSAVSSLLVTAVTPELAPGRNQAAKPVIDRHAIFAALGDTLIPTSPGDPGYRSLEPYKITMEVMKGLEAISDADLGVFDRGCGAFFDGRTFLQLTESQRAEYLRLIIDGTQFADTAQLRTLQRVYRRTRTRVFMVFYQNYPENVIPRDRHGVPILKPSDLHQITNPNTKELVTGWDIAGFEGPLSWEEEEARRAHFKPITWDQ